MSLRSYIYMNAVFWMVACPYLKGMGAGLEVWEKPPKGSMWCLCTCHELQLPSDAYCTPGSWFPFLISLQKCTKNLDRSRKPLKGPEEVVGWKNLKFKNLVRLSLSCLAKTKSLQMLLFMKWKIPIIWSDLTFSCWNRFSFMCDRNL